MKNCIKQWMLGFVMGGVLSCSAPFVMPVAYAEDMAYEVDEITVFDRDGSEQANEGLFSGNLETFWVDCLEETMQELRQ